MPHNDILLLNWKGTPITRIKKDYQQNIINTINKNPNVSRWYDHPGEKWIEAFNHIDQIRENTMKENMEAIKEQSIKKKIRKRENIEISHKLLEGICKAFQLEEA